MAAIPAYLIVGDYKGLCGTQPTDMLPSPGSTAGSGAGGLGALGYSNAITFWSFGLNLPWLMRTVPITFTGEPNYSPWWDGAASSGAGAFRKYHHVPASEFTPAFVSDSFGDNWFSSVKTFGWSAGFMEAMGRKHRNNPAEGFKCLKFGYSAGRAALWAGAGNAAFDALDTELDAMEAAMGSDTLDWTAIIVDWGVADIENNSSTGYYVSALAAISAIRNRIGDTTNAVPVFIVNHDRRLFKTAQTVTPPNFPDAITSADYIRLLNGQIAALANGNIHLVDRQSLNTLANNSFASAASFEADNPVWYPPVDHLTFGRETLPSAIAAVEADVPSSASSMTGIPTIVMMGDSQCAGSTNPITAVYGGESGSVANGYIWNGDTRQVELYEPVANALTVPDVSLLYYGTEYGLIKHALASGWGKVLVIKIGKAGATLTTEASTGLANLGIAADGRRTYDPDGADLFPELVTMMKDACQACVRDTGLVPDVRGLAIFLGDNDSASVLGGDAFTANVAAHLEDFRATVKTRTTGEALPVVWIKLPRHTSTGGQSSLGLAAQRTAIRAALDSLAEADARVALIDGDNYDLREDDAIHYAGSEIDNIGKAIVDAVVAIEAAG